MTLTFDPSRAELKYTFKSIRFYWDHPSIRESIFKPILYCYNTNINTHCTYLMLLLNFLVPLLPWTTAHNIYLVWPQRYNNTENVYCMKNICPSGVFVSLILTLYLLRKTKIQFIMLLKCLTEVRSLFS